MTTTIDVCDPDVIKQLAMAKARGRSWQIIGEKNNIPANVLDYLPWHLPKEWANACKYAEKLVAHEALAETLAELRLQMKDPTLPTRLKTQLANSIVRIIQQQHALRTPKQPKKVTRQPLQPIEQPIPETPVPKSPVPNPVADTPKPTASAPPLGAVATMLLFVLLGVFGVACQATARQADSALVVAMTCEHVCDMESCVGERREVPISVEGFYHPHWLLGCVQSETIANVQNPIVHRTTNDTQSLSRSPPAG